MLELMFEALRRRLYWVALSLACMVGLALPVVANAAEVYMYDGTPYKAVYGPRHSLTSVAFTWRVGTDGGVNAIIDGTYQYAGQSFFTDHARNNLYVSHPYCACRLLDGIGFPNPEPSDATGYWREYY